MCTVTFFPKDDHNWVLSTNRDELKSRDKALPPSIFKAGELNYLAPIDGKAGGTWVGMNEAGICLTLLNNYQGVNPLISHHTDALSRGLIIPKLMHLTQLNEVDNKMKTLQTANYNPFRLVGIQSKPWKLMEWSWDGMDFQIHSHPVKPHLWVSAGRDYEGVWNSREKVFKNFLKANPLPDVAAIKRLHASRYPDPGAYAFAMELDIVATVSNTIAELHGGKPRMHYHDGIPLKSGTWEVTDLTPYT
ncbi:MAG: NRDE family protein [Balneolales bacterium]